jgi:hypothetical protein
VLFGPHHFLEITGAGDQTTFAVGATHHPILFVSLRVSE